MQETLPRAAWLSAYRLTRKELLHGLELAGTIEDVTGRCAQCNGMLIREYLDHFTVEGAPYMRSVIYCPEAHQTPRGAWLEIWQWPEGVDYLRFTRSPEGRCGLIDYVSRRGFDPIEVGLRHSDPKVPLCFDDGFIEFPFFSIEGHAGAYKFPKFLHRPPEHAGVGIHPLITGDEREMADHMMFFEYEAMLKNIALANKFHGV